MFVVNIYYTGSGDKAKQFAEEMLSSGIVEEIRTQEGNLGYNYYQSLEDPHTILLIDSWKDQEALDKHHQSPMMEKITKLREKYDLTMRVERFVSEENIPEEDKKFIKTK